MILRVKKHLAAKVEGQGGEGDSFQFGLTHKRCKGNTKALHPSKKVYNLYTNICFLPVPPLVKECVCFYCHLTLFMRNKLIHNGFKSVR